MAAEIREKLIVLTEEEMPYSTAVVIDRFEEGESLHRIFASIFVERDSQKAIVIGKGGQKLKQIGTEAREDLEAFFGRKIFSRKHSARNATCDASIPHTHVLVGIRYVSEIVVTLCFRLRLYRNSSVLRLHDQ